MTLLLLYLLLALVVSAFCSVAEAVLLSVRPSYVQALKSDGKSSADTLAKLTGNLDRPLAAILTANTIAHTVGAAGVGAQAANVFGNAYLGVTSAVLTFLILVFSEIIPKTIGATYWQQLAPTFAVLINGLTRLLFPLVWMSERLTRLFAASGGHGASFSRGEMKAMAEMGAKTGQLDQREVQIVSNLMLLKGMSVREIMTPRPVITSLPADISVKAWFEGHAEKTFSRLPIYADEPDNVIGYVLRSDLLEAQANDDFAKSLSEYKRDFLVLPDILSAAQTFDRLLAEKSHIALVVDEYGTLQGIVTLEDIVETLMGLEIVDELDSTEDMQQLAIKQWRDRMQSMGLDPESLRSASDKKE